MILDRPVRNSSFSECFLNMEKENPDCYFLDIKQINETAPIDDWLYTMRRSMQEILPGIFLGPYGAAGKSKLGELINSGITHVVCVRQDIETKFIKPNFPDFMRYLVVSMADNLTEMLIPKVQEVKEFIDTCLLQGGKVLVHCNDGMSRSPSLVIAYIMQTFGLTFKAALMYVQARRFCVQPSQAFATQLVEFEPITQALGLPVYREAVARGLKRDRDNEDSDDFQGSSSSHLVQPSPLSGDPSRYQEAADDGPMLQDSRSMDTD